MDDLNLLWALVGLALAALLGWLHWRRQRARHEAEFSTQQMLRGLEREQQVPEESAAPTPPSSDVVSPPLTRVADEQPLAAGSSPATGNQADNDRARVAAAEAWAAAERSATEELDRIRAEALAAKAAEAAAQAEAERAAAEAASREAERQQAEKRRLAEEAARLEAERIAAEEAARLEAERIAAEEAARREAERIAAQEAARIEAERLAAELAARIEAERLAADLAARVEAERLAAEEAERRAAQEAARVEAERRAAEEAARAQAERRAAEEAALAEAERRAAEQATRISAERAAAARVRRPEETLVMVADDSKVVRVKTSRLLTAHRYRVVLAEDGDQAARLIEQEVPLVLITDNEMPGLDGFALTRHVRAHPRAKDIAIIMVTSADDRLKEAASEAGVTLVLGKPYEEAALLACIEQAQAMSPALVAA